jgi:hypothetical protein
MYNVINNKLIKIKKPQIVVDVSTQFKFTQENLETSNRLVVEDSYPQFYGEDLPESFKYVGRYIVDIVDIEWENKYENTQSARAGGGNPKYKEIKQKNDKKETEEWFLNYKPDDIKNRKIQTFQKNKKIPKKYKRKVSTKKNKGLAIYGGKTRRKY